MEPPVAMDARAIRDEKVKVLRAIRPLIMEGAGNRDQVEGSPWRGSGNGKGSAASSPALSPQHSALTPCCIRGQYGPGSFAGNPMKGYREEEGVAPDSKTETFVALKLYIDTWRWSGVPFYLRHGKRLPKRLTEIAIQFRSPPMAMFRGAEQVPDEPNMLVLRVQPDEGISLSFDAKVPGMRMRLGQVKMDFRYGSSFGGEAPEAYERLLLDAMLGDSTLFIRSDDVEYSWRLIDPLLAEWQRTPAPEFPNYDAGTWGPAEADRLFQGTNHTWRRL
jgi:glucose-6-phosphate 1-dehydrogenase